MFVVRFFLMLSVIALGACERKSKLPANKLHEQRQSFAKADEGRVTLRFRPSVDVGLPIEFRFNKPAERVTMGQPVVAWGIVTNHGKTPVGVSFVNDVSPQGMASHIKISDCFCTSRLTLPPGQHLDVSLKVEVLEDIHLAEDIFHLNFLAKRVDKNASDAH